MITLIRWLKLQQLRTKWELALYQFLDQQLKNPEEFKKEFVHEFAQIIHNANNKTNGDSVNID